MILGLKAFTPGGPPMSHAAATTKEIKIQVGLRLG